MSRLNLQSHRTPTLGLFLKGELLIHRIASMSKSFTGLAILLLRDRSLLALDDVVSKYLGQQFADAVQASRVTTDSPPLTIRHLLNHAGGFPTDDPWADRLLGDTKSDYDKLLSIGLTHSNVAGCRSLREIPY